MRPAGEVSVKVSVAALKTLLEVLPLVVAVSVSVVRLSGSLTSASTALRCWLDVAVRPDGVFTVLEIANGACIPKRGSGPCWVKKGGRF